MKKAFISGPVYSGDLYLRETVNDVTNWLATLTGRGFSQITVKNSPEATTRAALRTSLAAFVASLVDGDSAAIVLLGHGGQVTDTSGEERDGLDECYSSSDLLPISDDELGSLISSCPRNCKVDMIMDYCHAGTPDGPFGFASRLAAGRIFPAQWAAWGACNEAELSYSALSSGLWYSLFSLYLCWALRTYPAMSCIDLMTLVRGYVQAAVPGQNPQMAGAYLNRIPF
jgi:hypothetical protein